MAASHICQNCGAIGRPKRYISGTAWTELGIWALTIPGFLFGGLLVAITIALIAIIYGVWRVSKARMICPKCRVYDAMLPLNTPRGKELADHFKKS
jgi:hypothetical protein